jgi:RNA polymerase sigma-70 factor, ECF subfamily
VTLTHARLGRHGHDGQARTSLKLLRSVRWRCWWEKYPSAARNRPRDDSCSLGTGGRRLISMAMWKTVAEGAEHAGHDERDIRAALGRDDVRRALALIMNRYGDEVYRLAYAMTHSYHLAEEVRQQVFVEVYRDLASFSGRTSLRAWVFGIARHRCLDIAKKHRRWTTRFKNEPPADEEPDDHQPDREIDRSRIAKLLAACLAKLAPAARDAVVLRYHQDLSYDEASAIAGDNAGTLQQRVARALPALRRCIDAHLHAGPSR